MYDKERATAAANRLNVDPRPAGEAPRPVGSITAAVDAVSDEVRVLEELASGFGRELSRLLEPVPSKDSENGKATPIGSSVESRLQDIYRRLHEIRSAFQHHADRLSSAL